MKTYGCIFRHIEEELVHQLWKKPCVANLLVWWRMLLRFSWFIFAYSISMPVSRPSKIIWLIFLFNTLLEPKIYHGIQENVLSWIRSYLMARTLVEGRYQRHHTGILCCSACLLLSWKKDEKWGGKTCWWKKIIQHSQMGIQLWKKSLTLVTGQ